LRENCTSGSEGRAEVAAIWSAASPDPTPAKLPNNAGVPVAEVVEGRRPAEGNAASKTRPGRRAGCGASSALERVRDCAVQDKGMQFTALLLHHVDVPRLGAAHRAINPRAASGVDEVTWEAYGQNLEGNLRDLHRRVHRGGYRARPARRAYIPKHDGRKRPLGIAALEDKILQRAVVEVLNGIYEADFMGFSYGFRPGRSAHDALDALAAGIYDKKVNWVLDADFRKAPDNRHGEGDERALHRRTSDPRWPRPCVGDPRGRSEALDRGARRPAIEPRNKRVRGADVVGYNGRQHRWRRFREPAADPAGSENPSMRAISSC
jgi:Reverse transcriptase (RNA-dependent DNA polymerase)